jgi:hypothetical protein
MDHKELDVWKESMFLAKEVYFLTKSFPKDELYGITSQIRRASVSVPSNIAEGAARSSDKEFIQKIVPTPTLTTHFSPFTTHHSPFTIHHSPFTTWNLKPERETLNPNL